MFLQVGECIDTLAYDGFYSWSEEVENNFPVWYHERGWKISYYNDTWMFSDPSNSLDSVVTGYHLHFKKKNGYFGVNQEMSLKHYFYSSTSNVYFQTMHPDSVTSRYSPDYEADWINNTMVIQNVDILCTGNKIFIYEYTVTVESLWMLESFFLE